MGIHPGGGRHLPHPQPRQRQAAGFDHDRHRQRHLAAPVGRRGRHLPDVEGGAHPGGHRAPALFLGRRQVRGHRWHGRCGWHCAADLAGSARCRPAVDHLGSEGTRKAHRQKGRRTCCGSRSGSGEGCTRRSGGGEGRRKGSGQEACCPQAPHHQEGRRKSRRACQGRREGRGPGRKGREACKACPQDCR